MGVSLCQREEFMSGSVIAFGEQAFPKLLFFTSFPSVISPTPVTFSASAPLRKVTLNPCLLPRASSLLTLTCVCLPHLHLLELIVSKRMQSSTLHNHTLLLTLLLIIFPIVQNKTRLTYYSCFSSPTSLHSHSVSKPWKFSLPS